MSIFKTCPNCASPNTKFDGKKFECKSCETVFYLSTATATAAIIEYNEEICFIVRGREPKKGFLDLPGGFVEYGETAEDGLIREIQEEIGLLITKDDLNFVCTEPNDYHFKGVDYHTCDIIYHTNLKHKEVTITDLDEISKVVWINRNDIDYEKIAFKSLRNALKKKFKN